MSRMPPVGAAVPGPETLWPLRAGREVVPAHEPAVVGDRRVVQQVVADDPVELLVQVLRGDPLKEPVAVIVGILRRVGLRIVRHGAASDLAAVADRWTVVPVEARAALKPG